MQYATTGPYSVSLPRLSEELGLGPVQRYSKRLAVEYSFSAGDARASGMLFELYQKCLAEQDMIGAANWKLIKADSVVSLPFTNPKRSIS
jgi:hypothetical protein